MYLSGVIGCVLLLYVPLFFSALAAVLLRPQLLLIFLVAAFVGFCGLFFTALLYLPLKEQLSLAPLFLVFHVATTGVLRVVLIFLLYRAECMMRRHGQLFVASSFRFALVSAAVGCGFGAISVLRGAGVFLDANWRLIFYTEGTVAYDMNICPRFPLLAHSSIQAFFLLKSQIAWGVMAGQAVAALQRGRHSWRSYIPWGCNDANASDIFFEDLESCRNAPSTSIKDANLPQSCDSTGEDAAPFIEQSSRRVGAFVEGPLEGGDQRAEEEGEDAGAQDLVPAPHTVAEATGGDTDNGGSQPLLVSQDNWSQLPQPTLLYKKPLLAVVSLLAVFLFHLLFALATLLNDGAYDFVAFKEVQMRGCMVSLPIQASVTLVSSLWMVGIMCLERKKAIV